MPAAIGRKTRGRTLLFDRPLIGFARWAKKRLQHLGFAVVGAVGTSDLEVRREAAKLNAIIVSTDNDFRLLELQGRAIVLPASFPTQRGVGKPKYEKLYTVLMRKLHELLFKDKWVEGGKRA